MNRTRGYALLETLLASLILASALVAIASLFSVTTGTNIRNEQRTAATLLLYDKMEQLRALIFQGGIPAGGGIDPINPIPGFIEYVRIAGDGTMTIDNSDLHSPYLRLWEVRTSGAPTVTVVVYGRIGAMPPFELARATGYW